MDRIIISVFGKDNIGIMSNICKMVEQYNINIVDIRQTILHDYFNMIMIADAKKCKNDMKTVQDDFKKLAERLQLDIKVQKEDIFNAMHRV